MKTLTKNLAKRSLSVLLVLMMVFSLLTVGLTTVSAANAFDFYLRGGMNNWSNQEAYHFTNTSTNVYTATGGTLNAGTNYSCKMYDNGNNKHFGVRQSNGGANYEIVKEGDKYTVTMYDYSGDVEGGNIFTINVDTTGTYSLTYDMSKDTLVIELSSSGGNTGGETGGTVPTTLYLDTTFWNNAENIEKYSAVFTVGTTTTTVAMTLVEGNIYSVSVPANATKVKFLRLDGNGGSSDGQQWNYTANMAIPTNGNDMFTVEAWNNGTTTWSKYVPANSFTDFWVDTNANIPYANDAVDILVPYFKDGGDTYYLYLPSGADADKLKFYAAHDGVSVNGTAISTTGTEVKVTADGKTVHTLAGATVTKLVVFKSTASALYTKTDEAMPIKPGYDTLKGEGIHKDDYETENVKTENADGTVTNSQFYAMANPDGSLVADKKKNTVPVLKKVKGRGNSSWEASAKLFGKYAFNITLGDSSDLVGDDGTMSKKYCLISYNADEARMRNMLVYSLSQEIGLNFIADYKPVDLYNNNRYIGSYLLTDKVEIGDPLVEIVNLDEINEKLYGDSYGDDIYRACINNYDLDETSKPGFDKYYDYSRLGKDDVDEDVYAQSGFLLEFENYDRFAAEMAGFISYRGQQIVCKYPEYPSKAQLQFIESKWNTIEYKLYTEDLDYDTLSQYIDVESFAKMYLIQELTKNVDAGATSYYVYYHNGKFNAGVSWDYDWALGQYALNRTLVKGNTKFPATNSTALSNPKGWWASIKGIYTGFNTVSNEYNFQAKLCQNNAFWKVVLAEWNENFKPLIDGYVVNSANTSTPANLSGKKIHEFYDQVHASTLMDESRWGFIAADKMGTNGEEGSWGSKDTGDTHDDTTVWLNDFVYDRVTWMNNSGLNATDYTIQPPVLTADVTSCQVGETVNFTIEDKSSGTFTYTIYKDGVAIAENITSNTYALTAENGSSGVYTVTATSAKGKTSEASEGVNLKVEGFTFELEVKAPESVGYNDKFDVIATSNADADYEVAYEFWLDEHDMTESKKTDVNGYFAGVHYDSRSIGLTATWTIKAKVTVGGKEYTAEKSGEIKITDYKFEATLNAPETVEIGMEARFNATVTKGDFTEVTYTFYDSEDKIIATNGTGILYVAGENVGDTFTYYVVANAKIVDFVGIEKTYTATSAPKTVTVVEIAEAYNVTVYFKSTSTLGYKPKITTEGAVENLSDSYMEKAIYIGMNSTMTASYWWYKAELQVSRAAGELYVDILSSRYAMEVWDTFEITSDNQVLWLGVDDLNSGSEMINMTDFTEEQRKFTVSAVHMVYDPEIDGKDKTTLAEVSAMFNPRFVGDANGDGKVNIKDATLIQKSLALLTNLDDTATIVSDITDDGSVTIKDATALQKRLAGL